MATQESGKSLSPHQDPEKSSMSSATQSLATHFPPTPKNASSRHGSRPSSPTTKVPKFSLRASHEPIHPDPPPAAAATVATTTTAPTALHARRDRVFGMQISHGMPIPEHMIDPLEDGYRTPTFEDYERHFFRRRRNVNATAAAAAGAAAARAVRHATHSSDVPGATLARSPASYLSFAAVSEKLDEKLHWKERIRHFTWNFFSMVMATGGIANVLYHGGFSGLEIIGDIVFLGNLYLFLGSIVLICIRFFMWPETFKASFLHPTESLFVPSSVVAFATVILNITQYGLPHTGPWLFEAVLVLFWIFVCLAILLSVGIYLLMWSTQTFTIAKMTPVWIFPAYPLLLVGPLAGQLLSSADQPRALDISIAGFTCQGIGFLVSMMMYSAFLYRLMTQKLPRENIRPGMFVSVGPSAFTVSAIINICAGLPSSIPDHYMGDGHFTATVLQVVGNFVSLWLWGLAIWWFIISAGAHISCIGHGRLQFAMTWFSFIFPNTALVTATFAIANAFDSRVIRDVGCVATCILIAAWLGVFVMMLRAIHKKQILWPQKQDDRDEGGFKAPEARRKSSVATLNSA